MTRATAARFAPNVTIPSTAEVVEFNGEAYYFCEPVCAEIFRDEPLRWIEPAPEQI